MKNYTHIPTIDSKYTQGKSFSVVKYLKIRFVYFFLFNKIYIVSNSIFFLNNVGENVSGVVGRQTSQCNEFRTCYS